MKKYNAIVLYSQEIDDTLPTTKGGYDVYKAEDVEELQKKVERLEEENKRLKDKINLARELNNHYEFDPLTMYAVENMDLKAYRR